jgi:hypothetical protein
VLKRSENSILYKQKVPHDKRFLPIKANYDLLSNYQTLHVSDFKGYSPRRELFNPPELQPQYDFEVSNILGHKPGVPNFKRYTERPVNSNCRPYPQPEGYELSRVDQGYRALSEFKNPKGYPRFEKSMPRNDAMYNFDREVVRKIKLKRQEFSFSSYLPNGLKGASHISLASTAAASVLKNCVHQIHSRNDQPSSRKSEAASFCTIPSRWPKIDQLRQINGSFLCEDRAKRNKLVDASGLSNTLRKATTEYITGESSRTLGHE